MSFTQLCSITTVGIIKNISRINIYDELKKTEINFDVREIITDFNNCNIFRSDQSNISPYLLVIYRIIPQICRMSLFLNYHFNICVPKPTAYFS